MCTILKGNPELIWVKLNMKYIQSTKEKWGERHDTHYILEEDMSGVNFGK